MIMVRAVTSSYSYSYRTWVLGSWCLAAVLYVFVMYIEIAYMRIWKNVLLWTTTVRSIYLVPYEELSKGRR